MVRKGAKKRNARVLRGQGGYFDKSKNGEVTSIGKALRWIGGAGGGAIAPFAGASPVAGNLAGRNLAAHISKWLGYGAYRVRNNSIVTGSDTIPAMHSAGQSVVVRHKEYIGDVVSSQAYTKQFEVALNPGLPASFPWLSSIARQYQEYTWKGVVFHFVPTVGEAVSATVPAFGNVMMHTEYRVTAPEPANKAELLNEYFASDARPSETFIHPIECDPKENPYNVQYIRTGGILNNEDPKTYDLGMFRLFTQGQAADGITMGELWVTYEVQLRKPQLTSQSGDIAWFRGTGTFDTAHPLGTTLATVSNGLGASVTSASSRGRVYFPQGVIGKFLVTITWNPNGNLTLGTVTLFFTGTTQLSIMGGSGGDGASVAAPTAQNTGASLVFAVLTSGDSTQYAEFATSAATNMNGSMIVVTRLDMSL